MMATSNKILLVASLLCALHVTYGWIRIPPIRIPPIRIPFFRAIGNFFVKGFNILTKGCCGLHPSYCRNRDDFKRRQAQIKAKSVIIDRDWAYVKKRLAQIKAVNHNNQIIFRNVRRVTLASTLTVETLDPNVIAKMNNVANELKKAIRAKNDTVLQYNIDKVGKEFEKTEEKSKTALLDASGIGGFGMSEGFIKMTADMFKLVKLDGVAKFLTTEVGGFLTKVKSGISKLFGFHYLEKLAETNKAAKIAMGVINFFNKYLNLASGIFKVFELFGKFVAWISDLATCNKRKKEMEVNLRDLKKKQIEINAAYNKLRTNKNTVNSNWNKVFKQAKDEGLLTNLKEAQKIASHSSGRSNKMKESNHIISNYLRSISRSTPDGAINLQNSLIYALGNITYNSECYQRKLATYTTVTESCKLGRASFDALYEQAIKDFRTNSIECKGNSGLPYTTKVDVRKHVDKMSKKHGFEKDCLLNSGIKKAIVCNQLHSGYSLEQAAGKANLDYDLVHLYEQSCLIEKLSPYEIKSICLMKKYKSIGFITNIFPNNDEVKDISAQCA